MRYLMHVADMIERFDILPVGIKGITSLLKTPTYLFRIGPDGQVEGPAYLPPTEAMKLTRLEENNVSFPVFKWKDEEKDVAISIQEMVKKGKKFSGQFNAVPPSMATLLERLEKIPADDLARVCKDGIAKVKLQRKVEAKEAAAIVAKAVKAAKAAGLPSPKPKKEKESANVYVAFDIADLNKFDYQGFFSSGTVVALNNELRATFASDATNEKDAFGGSMEGWKEAGIFARPPDLNLTIKFFTRNDEHAANWKYGRSSFGSMPPVGRDNKERAAAALVWLLNPSRYRKTWDVYEKVGKGRCYILPVYEGCDEEMWGILGGCQVGQSINWDQTEFLNKIEAACQALKGSGLSVQGNFFYLTVIVPSNGAASILASAEIGLDRMGVAQEDWYVGCRNLPSNEKIKYRYPSIFSYLTIINQQWTPFGKNKVLSKTPNMTFEWDDAFNVFIGKENNVRAALKHFVNNHTHLIVEETNCYLTGQPSEKFSEVVKGVPVLGLLLHKLGHGRDEYMKSFEYYLGGLCRQAVKLEVSIAGNRRTETHGIRCLRQILNGGSVTGAVADLGKRISYYHPQAQREDGNFQWLYYDNINAQLLTALNDQEMPDKLTDEQKACVTLGFFGYFNLIEKKEVQVTQEVVSSGA